MSTRNRQAESKVFHRSVNSQQLAVASGRGCTLVLEDGREVLDGAAGAAVACLGHGNRNVQQAILSQMDKISYIHAQVYTSGPIEELAALLVESTGNLMSRVVFTSSGIVSTCGLLRGVHIIPGTIG
jgi:Adenosylmethionine-8-amino-7-oxononanoate aminotransferase